MSRPFYGLVLRACPRPTCGVCAAVLALAGAFALASAARAEPAWEAAVEPPSAHYNGTYLGGGGGALLSFVDGAPAGGVEAYARLGLVLNLVDAVVRYRWVRAPGWRDVGLDRHGVAASARLHPLFVRLTRQGYLDFVLSALYAEVGLGLDFDHPLAPVEGVRSTSASVHLGAGVDVPLGRPTGPSSWWLGLRYQRQWALPPATGLAEMGRREHTIVLSLDWRWHNLRFTRVPRPPGLGLGVAQQH